MVNCVEGVVDDDLAKADDLIRRIRIIFFKRFMDGNR